MLPKKLQKKIDERKASNSLRNLGKAEDLVDFSSNDYLGFSKSETIFKSASQILEEYKLKQNGATGSRLLTGNHQLYSETERQIANFHNTEECLIFNSGYDANIGFFSSVPQRGDIILYDEFVHASIRDGILMSNAKAYKFRHNDLKDLKNKLSKIRETSSEENVPKTNLTEVYIVTESVFSMDGDTPDLKELVDFCKENRFHLIVDEAHAVGVFGENGSGIVQQLKLENDVFARIVTFGKALGCHGAAILGSESLKTYLVNFARSFIYTTALPPHSIASIASVYSEGINTKQAQEAIEKLQKNISFFKSELKSKSIQHHFIYSESAIHCCIIPGNEFVKEISKKLRQAGFDVKPILSPTVPEGKERLRICLHSFNSKEEIASLVKLLAIFVV